MTSSGHNFWKKKQCQVTRHIAIDGQQSITSCDEIFQTCY